MDIAGKNLFVMENELENALLKTLVTDSESNLNILTFFQRTISNGAP